MPADANTASTRYRFGVDSGGTFTDVCALNEETGVFTAWKVSSTPQDPSHGIVEGAQAMLERLSSDNGTHPDVAFFAHGTTVATNALIERRGARTALVTTRGFRDVLEIARQRRPELYNLQTVRPEPLVSRDLRFEVSERIQFDGSILDALNEDEVRALASVMRDRGVQAVAVSFLFSFLNPVHEQRVKEILEEECPGLFISISSQVVPEFREYERTSTVTVNSYLGPMMQAYLGKLESTLADIAPSGIKITQSNGGLISASVAGEEPVRTVLSGPAAGVMGALEIAKRTQHPNLITFDMGGTSADVSIIEDYAPRYRSMASVEGFPIKVPMIDIHAVGAGGGSIAYNDHGLLKVGPRSAGANPGPACYGLGNLEPTVTDANIALGTLNQKFLLNGRLPIDASASRMAVKRLGASFGLEPERTAAGILEVVTANMINAIRAMTVERGLDPRDFALFSFGGAGPLHSGYLARELGISKIVVPALPGVMCALGLLTSGMQIDLVRTYYGQLDTQTVENLHPVLNELLVQAREWFETEHIGAARQTLQAAVDLRYGGQAYELTIPIALAPNDISHPILTDAFISAHRERYGYIIENEPIYITAVRLRASAGIEELRPAKEREPRAGDLKPIEYRDIYDAAKASFSRTPVYDKLSLPQGMAISGPCVIEQMDTTIYVLEGQVGTIDLDDNFIISAK